MDVKYLNLLAKDYPTINSAASEIISLSAIRSLPKGTEYFFSDLHGENKAFLHMLKSASGMIKNKIDLTLGKTLPASEREELAYLIYYPDKAYEKIRRENRLSDEWRQLTIYRLVQVCETISAKYTRSWVRHNSPSDTVAILDELLNVTDDVNKDYYYEEIISSILETGIADHFIHSLCQTIQALAIDSLHIIGDIFDRGPRPDLILDELMRFHDVDIQWGNHDISWMGAVSGNPGLIANVVRISIQYNNFDLLEDGYGLNLRPLAIFANEYYKEDRCELFMPKTLDDNIYDPVDINLAARMHKAITIIQLKLEGQLIEHYPEWGMAERNVFRHVDFRNGTVEIKGRVYPLKDTFFPTVDPDDPLALTDKEKELMAVLTNSFIHSKRLNEHIRFLYSRGSMYKTVNGNLLFHGCIPMKEDGSFMSLTFKGTSYSGKDLLDKLNELANQAYFSSPGKEKEEASDYLWYLWCGPRSPLFGKDKMAFFERLFIDDKDLHVENYNAYYQYSHKAEVCRDILAMFGLDPDKGHIINGHVPVKIKNGESPVKADGKLYVIDGGISKAYQKTTGIAGYTLIYSSHSLNIAEHKPFVAGESELSPSIQIVEKLERRANISDIDQGRELAALIEDLRELLIAYRSGLIKEH